jgi:hypothetical protein
MAQMSADKEGKQAHAFSVNICAHLRHLRFLPATPPHLQRTLLKMPLRNTPLHLRLAPTRSGAFPACHRATRGFGAVEFPK